MQILTDLIPLINARCNPGILSRIYLQFAQIMLTSGDFRSALEIFEVISRECEELPQYTDTLTQLLKEGVLKDAVAPITQAILPRLIRILPILQFIGLSQN